MGNIGSSEKSSKIEHDPGVEINLPQEKQDVNTGDENSVVSTTGEDNVETPVLLKNQHHIMALIDPRSPTQEISRTPIALEDQQTGQPSRRLNPRVALLKENGATPGSASSSAGFVDPRSPTQDIDRTPIRFTQRDGLANRKITCQ